MICCGVRLRVWLCLETNTLLRLWIRVLECMLDVSSLLAGRQILLDEEDGNDSVVYVRANTSLSNRNLLDDDLSGEEVVSNDEHDDVNKGDNERQ